MAVAVAEAGGTLDARFATADDQTDRPDTLPPSFWSTHPSNLGDNAPQDLLTGMEANVSDGKPSKFYHYPDAVFSDSISRHTREWLRACWTDVDKVKEMLAAGADVMQTNANGFTGLHMAASKLKVEIAELLVEAGHDVNAEEANGLTPLDYCVDSGMQGEVGSKALTNNSRAYAKLVEFLEARGAYRKEERCWLQAANQEKYAPNLP
mmetsp:Transcript_46729/g.117683  ORF Transcript_46729/g.117683 Transcript_46729/m.117683 type:complete len:208 (+) Transcript_46729:69-692(+)